MRKKLISILLILAFLLTACGYVVVEDSDKITIGSLFGLSARAEEALEIESADAQKENPSEETDAPPALRPGMKGEEVRALQNLLKKYGFMIGSADGVFGKQTEAGVQNAQDYKGKLDREEAEKEKRERIEIIMAAQEAAMKKLYALYTEDELSASEPEADFSMVNIGIDPIEKEEKSETIEGVCDRELLDYLENDFVRYAQTLKKGSKGDDVERLQRKLYDTGYLPGGVDGQFGNNTFLAVKYFQRTNGLKETGVADEETQLLLFSEKMKNAEKPAFKYKVEISISKQKVYVYEWHYGSYSKLVKTMTCTTGTTETPTPLGTFKMGGPCGRWYFFKKFDCWAQYASRIVGGILFHSVIYSEKDVNTLRQSTVNALGTRASHGCVRLSVENAEWIYRNIPAGTTCRIYN
ncbi:MAG: peptidoglycan-binding protein [Clostridia bacterium]|nr:peptidoglycan-binding protein [Clostridia bacterium]